MLTVDAALALGLLWLALRAGSFWPMWAAAFQLVAVMFHLGAALLPGAGGWSYAVGVSVWSVPVMLALLLGCARSRRSGPAELLPRERIGHGIG